MKTLLRPRLSIALVLGVAAGLLTLTLPPVPRRTFNVVCEAPTKGYLELQTVSLDGRMLIINHLNNDRAKTKIEIWDLDDSLETPRFTVTRNGADIADAFLSPDETSYAVTGPDTRKKPKGRRPNVIIKAQIHDLATGAITAEHEAEFGASVFFSTEGNLLAWHESAVRDLRNGKTKRHLPELIDGFRFHVSKGKYAVYRKEQFLRVYSLLTGEIHAEATMPFVSTSVQQISTDGRILKGDCWDKHSTPASRFILDMGTGTMHLPDHENRAYDYGGVFSPDFRTVAFSDRYHLLPWLDNVWPDFGARSGMRFVRLANEQSVGFIANVKQVRFSPQGNLVAVMDDDRSLAIYDFPFRTPWGLIAGSGVTAAFLAWTIGWLWARWRGQKTFAPSAKHGDPRSGTQTV